MAKTNVDHGGVFHTGKNITVSYYDVGANDYTQTISENALVTLSHDIKLQNHTTHTLASATVFVDGHVDIDYASGKHSHDADLDKPTTDNIFRAIRAIQAEAVPSKKEEFAADHLLQIITNAQLVEGKFAAKDVQDINVIALQIIVDAKPADHVLKK